MSRASWLVLLWLLGSALSSLPAQAQTSADNSTPQEPLWSSLLELTNNLPGQIDSFRTSLEGQVSLLQVNNERLQSSNDSLTASNSSLQGSVRTLTLQNADLSNSLMTSQAALAISEQARVQSETALRDSIASITRAKADAKALALQVGVLKIGCITFGVGLVAVAIYEGGHALHWW